MTLPTFGWILIGVFFGWLVHGLLDILFWRNRRICTEDELRLRKQVETYEVERKGYQTQIADYDRRIADYDTRVSGYETRINDYEVQTTALQAKVDAPTVKVKKPDVKFTRGRVDVPDAPKVDIKAPKTPKIPKTKMPKVDRPDVDVPNVKAGVAGLGAGAIGAAGLVAGKLKGDVDLPDTPDVDIKAPEVDVPDVNIPDVDINAPSLDVDVPDVDLQVPEVDLPDVPDVDIKAPEVDLPSVDLDAPDVSGIGAGAKAGIVGAGAAAMGGARMLGGKMRGGDDLSEIWGVGRSVEQTLHTKDITTYRQIADSSVGDLQGVLDAEGDLYEDVDPATWPAQARLLADGKTDEFLVMKRDLARSSMPEGAEFDGEPDNFQKLYGIGPASEKLLYANGIYTYEQLANTPVDRLQGILDAKGGRMKLVDPTTWPEQARFAADGNWDELDGMQNRLSTSGGGVSGAVGAVAAGAAGVGAAAASKVSAVTGKPDDLKKIWGIGPAVERILNGAGISTFRQLADAPVENLTKVLTAAGDQFSLVQQESWSEQANLAADGDWEALEKLQDALGN